jgi:hypothetical protein
MSESPSSRFNDREHRQIGRELTRIYGQSWLELTDDYAGPTREPMRASRLRGEERFVAHDEHQTRRRRAVSFRPGSRSRPTRRFS